MRGSRYDKINPVVDYFGGYVSTSWGRTRVMSLLYCYGYRRYHVILFVASLGSWKEGGRVPNPLSFGGRSGGLCRPGAVPIVISIPLGS